MTNKSRERVQVASYTPKNNVLGELASVSRPDGSAETTLVNAGNFIAKAINPIADDLAKSEGKAAGSLAGLSTDFKPNRMPTLRGEAFDKAAIETYGNTLDTNLRNDLQTRIDANSASPSALKTSLDELRKEYLADHVFDEVRPAFEKTFSRLTLPALHAAQTTYDKAVAEGAKQSFEANAAAQRSTLTTASASVGIDPQADDAVAFQLDYYNATLARGVAAGHIEAPVAAAMQTDAAGSAATAAVTGMFNRMPDRDAQEQFLDRFDDATRSIGETYQGLDQSVLAGLKDNLGARLRRSTERAAVLENNADAIRQAQTEDQGVQLLKAGELTEDWADGNADRLGRRAEDYRNAALNAPAASQPFVYADLLRQAIDDPGATPGAAVTAVAEGALSRASFAEIHDIAVRVADDQAKRPWLNDIRRDVVSRTTPSDDQSDAQAGLQTQALPAFESWLTANPEASRAEIAAQANDLSQQFIVSGAASARATLPLPRFAQTARNEITPAALPAIAQRLSLSHDDGEIDDDELIAQSELLDKWKAALERHSGRGK